VHVLKGPYPVDAGDFATAGAVRLSTLRRLDEPFVTAGGGSFGTLRLVGATGGASGKVDGWMAGEILRSDGPFDAEQRLRRANVIGKATADLGNGSAAWLEAWSYGGGWNASGQIPLREVEAGRLSRFGSIDPSEGGASTRQALVAGLYAGELDVRAYLVRYHLDLFSNFTFALDDPDQGDGIEQVDHRTTAGLRADHHLHRTLGPLAVTIRAGGDARADDAEVALYHQRERMRLAVRNRARILESSQGVFAEAELAGGDRWHLAAGARADLFSFQVDGAEGTAMNGTSRRLLANPKGRADLRVLRNPRLDVRLFAAAGGGFHSNDARNVVATGEDALARAWGGEAGARVRERTGAWEVAAAGWGLWLERELVWVGDAGETDLRGSTRRAGVELTGRGRLLSWLGAELEGTFTHARFGNGDRIPLAPALTLVGGLIAHHPSGFAGQLRVRHLGDRPANEDASLTADGYTVVDLVGRYRWRDWEVAVDVDNLLDADWREAQFAFESRLPGEAAPVEDIHFTPGVPLSARASLTCYY
jgi:outer membrane receptor protein involved in Fe transport